MYALTLTGDTDGLESPRGMPTEGQRFMASISSSKESTQVVHVQPYSRSPSLSESLFGSEMCTLEKFSPLVMNTEEVIEPPLLYECLLPDRSFGRFPCGGVSMARR